MTKYRKTTDGKYIIKDKIYKNLVGSRPAVGHGIAYKTTGGLTQEQLIKIKGRWKSRKKHLSATADNRLLKKGYSTKKGFFGYVKLSVKPSKTLKVRSLAKSEPARYNLISNNARKTQSLP
jgi:hypothetical protein